MPDRPSHLPPEAFFDPDENEWCLGERNEAGKPVGRWVYWAPEGHKVCACTYDNEGQLHGFFERWHPNGERSQWAPWIHGKTHGVQAWTKPSSGPSDIGCTMPPNLPDTIRRMDMPYDQGVYQPDHFTLYLVAHDPVPEDETGRSIDLGNHIERVAAESTLFPVEPSFFDIAGDEVLADPDNGRWIYQGPKPGGFGIRHRQGKERHEYVLSRAEVSRAFTLSAPYYLSWRASQRPQGVPPKAIWNPATCHWELGERVGGPKGKQLGTWKWWDAEGRRAGETCFDAFGAKHGNETRYHPDGTASRAGPYTRGEPTGTHTFWRCKEDTDECFPRSAEVVRRAEVDYVEGREQETRLFLEDGVRCTRAGTPLAEAFDDARFHNAAVDGFLDEGFASFLDIDHPAETEVGDAIATWEDLWGRPMPAGLRKLVSEVISRNFPGFYEWRSEFLPQVVPEVEGNNVFESIVDWSQQAYLGTALHELFSGMVNVGTLGDGDSYHVSNDGGEVHHFSHDELRYEAVIAGTLDDFAFLVAASDSFDEERLSAEALRAVVGKLSGSVAMPWHWEPVFSDVEGFEPRSEEPSTALERFERAEWLVVLLRNDGIAGLEGVEESFGEHSFPLLSDADWALEVPRCVHDVPLGLYWLWGLFFFDEEKRLSEVVSACLQSPSKLLRDAAALVSSLVSGRTQLGSIEDIHSLRREFLALQLHPSQAAERAKRAQEQERAREAERVSIAAEVASVPKRNLVDLAWKHLTNALYASAIETRMREDSTLARSFELLDWMASATRDDPVISLVSDRFAREHDPAVVPLVVARLAAGETWTVAPLKALAPTRAEACLVELLEEGWESARCGAAAVLGRIGSADAREALRDALARRELPLDSLAAALGEAGVSEVLSSLGLHVEDRPTPELLWAIAQLGAGASDEARTDVLVKVDAIADLQLEQMVVAKHASMVLGGEVDDLRRWVRTCLAMPDENAGRSEKRQIWALRVAAEHPELEPEIVLGWVRCDRPRVRGVALDAANRLGLDVDVRELDPFDVAGLDVEALHGLLADDSVMNKRFVAERLTELAGHSAAPLAAAISHRLEGIWPHGSSAELFALVKAASHYDDPAVTEVFARCLEHERSDVAAPVVRVGVPQKPEFVPGMTKVASVGEAWMRRAAVAWLAAWEEGDGA